MIDVKGQAKDMDMSPSSVGRDSSWLDTGMQFLLRVSLGYGFCSMSARGRNLNKVANSGDKTIGR